MVWPTPDLDKMPTATESAPVKIVVALHGANGVGWGAH
jgi:hypothetical protein